MRSFFPVYITVFILSFLFIPVVSAQSSYVLPYPSSMPGSTWYIFDQIQEKLSPLWHFGEFASFKNNLYYADKYLVEAKTLFEYDQFLLATHALSKSDYYFEKVDGDLFSAKQSGKNITEKAEIFRSASEKHRAVLIGLKTDLPQTFSWNPEDGATTILPLHTLLDTSIEKRKL